MIEDQLEWDFVSWPFTALQDEREGGISSAPARLLLVGSSSEHTLLQKWLAEEGYAIRVAATVEEALALLTQRSFQCALVDLSARPSDSFLDAIELLRGRDRAILVGAITSEELSAEAEEHGVAFALAKPVQSERLFTELALGLHVPLTAEQERQAQVVKDFFAAVNAKKTHKMLELCTSTLSYYPSASHGLLSPFRPISSQGTLTAYFEFIRQRSLALRLEVENIYSRPRGLAVQYSAWWAGPHQRWEVQTDILLFHFLKDRIHQIGLRPDKESAVN